MIMVLAQLTFIKYSNQKESLVKLIEKFTFSKTIPSITSTSSKNSIVLSYDNVKDKIKNIFNTNRDNSKKFASLQSYQINHKAKKEVTAYAKNFLDLPYVWGAIGPDKFDCSGFTQKIYKHAGVKIPRVSYEQAKVGKLIKYDKLQRGDMVFFDTKRKETGAVNHVGIYLSKGRFIHASSGKKKVVITNFNTKVFYKNRFLWGRRIIQPQSKHFTFNHMPSFLSTLNLLNYKAI
jgi:cell wall-associated NlpC family hydrolase